MAERPPFDVEWFNAFYRKALVIGVPRKEARRWAAAMTRIVDQLLPDELETAGD